MAGKGSRMSGIAARLVVLQLGASSMALKSPTLFHQRLDKLGKRSKTDADFHVLSFRSLLIGGDKLSGKLDSQKHLTKLMICPPPTPPKKNTNKNKKTDVVTGSFKKELQPLSSIPGVSLRSKIKL